MKIFETLVSCFRQQFRRLIVFIFSMHEIKILFWYLLTTYSKIMK